MSQTAAKVREFIESNFAYGRTAPADGESLIEAGIVDSTGILELVSFIELELKVAVADDDIVPENLGSIVAICAYVDRRLAAESATSDAA
jgi:acyl carrier protein